MYDQLLDYIDAYLENGSTDDIPNIRDEFDMLQDGVKELVTTFYEKYREKICDNDHSKMQRIRILFQVLKNEQFAY